LTHAQKLGISYSDEEDNHIEQNSGSHESPDETAVESSVQANSNSLILVSHPITSPPNAALKSRPIRQDDANILVDADSEPVKTYHNGGSSGENTEGLTEVSESISEQGEYTDEGNSSQDFQPNEETS
jgi:ER degradation enhancer, mannosidase alpha-like 2